MAKVQIFNKETATWLTPNQIDNLLRDSLLSCEFEWEVSEC